MASEPEEALKDCGHGDASGLAVWRVSRGVAVEKATSEGLLAHGVILIVMRGTPSWQPWQGAALEPGFPTARASLLGMISNWPP